MKRKLGATTMASGDQSTACHTDCFGPLILEEFHDEAVALGRAVKQKHPIRDCKQQEFEGCRTEVQQVY
jgi:hypothetical protein